jgi:hypothetical protein
MRNDRSPLTTLGWVFAGLTLTILVAIALILFLWLEISEEGWRFPVSIIQSYFPSTTALNASVGDEFTGNATAFLFIASALPVVVDLSARWVNRYLPLHQTVKGFIQRLNGVQRKYLLPFHTYLSILALGFGFLHLGLSHCIANPFPEIGLILSGVLIGAGLLFKVKQLPKVLRKYLFQFHTSLIVSGLLITILFVGHSIMDME